MQIAAAKLYLPNDSAIPATSIIALNASALVRLATVIEDAGTPLRPTGSARAPVPAA